MKMYHPRTRRQGRRRVAVLAAAVTAAALALTGCTPAAEPESGNVTLDIGGAAGQMQENWNPYGFSTPVIMAAGFVFEPLVQYNALNADETYPWLAKEYKWSDDYTSLTFTLREGVNWSDGKPFTANDVVFTFNLLKNNPGMNFRQVQFDSVEALSDSEVRLNFASNSFSQQLPIFSTYIVPEHVWANQADPMAFTNPRPGGHRSLHCGVLRPVEHPVRPERGLLAGG
ncbi:ABC transporter substrate-binding protein [Arthrobacter sp. SD76]|uniref:ABC transporter substrate-binding protein n=1 Tax=Arthrobacter sp. SD76 TaxID=3415007 RepID=UPI003C7078A0